MNIPRTVHITCDITIDVQDLYDDNELEILENLSYDQARKVIIDVVKEDISDLFSIQDLNITVE